MHATDKKDKTNEIKSGTKNVAIVMDICFLVLFRVVRQRPLRRANHSPREAPSIVV